MEKAPIFVHPGFLRRPDSTIPASTVMRENPYGPYGKYLQNLRDFYRDNQRRSVFLLNIAGGQILPCHEGFEPRKEDIVLDFSEEVDQFAFYRKEGSHWSEREKIRKEQLASHLQKEGILDFNLVGEMGPNEKNCRGCVGAIWEFIYPHARIIGMPGCVYPLVPYTFTISSEGQKGFERMMGRKDHFYEERLKMFQDLYPDKKFP
ncbi:MAG: hypothetical protein Q8Q31_04355 [Nanoarchaeota archaeon]|nr:hypothetical protein [Nanoarchaeota archaeon]